LFSQSTTDTKTGLYSLDISKYGALSIMAVDVESGEVVVEHNPSQRMTPASLTKVITTGAALSTIDPDFTFETLFYVLENDGKKVIVVKGKGDPTLGSQRFDETKPEVVFSQLLMALKNEGITSVEKIIVDNSFFSGIKLPSKRLWEDMGNYYGAVPHSLTYRENTFRLTLKSPEGVGLPVEIVKTEPEIGVNINCLVKTADNTKDSAYIYGYEDASVWYVSGTIPSNRDAFSIKGAMPRPELVFAQELNDYLIENGILVNGYVLDEVKVSKDDQPLYIHYSPTLKEIAAVINKTSHNLWADHLLFQLAYGRYGKADWDSGVASLHKFWTESVPDFTGLFFDGSGLSPFNAFSACDMVKVLQYLNASESREVFRQSLAIAGVDGTMKWMLREDEFKGKVIGKSGSFNGVLGYCGYITTNKGKTIAFCMMANRFTETYKTIRGNMEQLMKELIIEN
jgi:D-alanyl-D-alanine carboxypeptidase/D-alanyl-D-alanine-endopeptidase (penicillin-binding protein 4)